MDSGDSGDEAAEASSFRLAGAWIADEDVASLLMAVLVDNADGIVIVDSDGVILAANPAAEELFGRSVDVLVGAPLGVPVASGVRTELEILAPKAMRYAELLSRSTVWQGQSARVVTLRDVTNRRRAVDALRDYVSMTAHEIATPLQSISGFAETLTSSWDNIEEPRRREFIEIIHRQAGRVASISQDLLALSKLDAAAVDHTPREVRVRSLVDQMLREGDGSVDGREVPDDGGFILDVGDDLEVLADPHHVETILRNFLSNAAKYGAGRRTIRAAAETRSGTPGVVLEVQDEGEGVPTDFVPHLFERFARARRGIANRRDGTGLGLALSHGLAELNEGEVGYRANEPRGSVFTLWLPAP